MSKCKLFCLPYAGGSSLVFSDWKHHLSHHIEIMPIEMKGRGHRLQEPFYEHTREAASDIVQEMGKSLKDGSPYCLFGQSVGGLIAYEMLHILEESKLHLPFHVFFSAIFPPHINKIQGKLHELSDKDFIKQLVRWASLPQALTNNSEMVQTWTPILKADYRILENYHFRPKCNQFPIDFTILKGKSDNWLSREEYIEWCRYSDRPIEFHEINGGHLFIHDQKQEIISIINKTIDGYF